MTVTDDRSRSQTLVTGRITVGEYSEVVRVRDLSEGGAKFECSRSFEPGTELVFETAKVGEVTAKVVWSKDGKIGIDFDTDVVIAFNAEAVELKGPKAATYRRPTLKPQITARAADPEDWR